MKTHSMVQGSPEWHKHRGEHHNASDAPAMLGVSPYKTRAALLKEYATGFGAEIDAGTQRLFDAGHRAEALARPLAEAIIGDDLYPVVGSNGRLSASFDGITLTEDTAFEHKSLNNDLRAVMVEGCTGVDLPLLYQAQMEQQCMVSGATRVLFMASKWDGEELVEERHCWYVANPLLAARIIAGWVQFDKDVDNYAPPNAVEPAPVGKAPDTLPAIHIAITGQVTASNLAEFKETALAAIRSVNRTLTTDADFADADKAIKWCGDVESRLAAAKEHALSQTASIDVLFKALDDIAAESKRVRLDLDKLVTRRKTEVKEEAIARARKALDVHVSTLNTEIAPMRLPTVMADFAGAIKGKKSFASMQDALDGMLAGAKIEADAGARAIRANLAVFKATAGGFEFLFSDLSQIVHKAPDDFGLQVQTRIDAHKAAEAEKARKALEADAERKRQAEAAEAARIAAALQTSAAPAPVAQPVAPNTLQLAAAPLAVQTRAAAQAEHEAGMKAEREAAAADAKEAADKAAKALARQRKADAAEKTLRDAAPLLLAALKRMLDAFYDDPMGNDTEGAVEQARDAIAAAEAA